MDMSCQHHVLAGLLPGKCLLPLRSHWIGGWVSPRAGLVAVANRIIPAPAWNRTVVVHPVAWSLYWLSYPYVKLKVEGNNRKTQQWQMCDSHSFSETIQITESDCSLRAGLYAEIIMRVFKTYSPWSIVSLSLSLSFLEESEHPLGAWVAQSV
jgi:hypothetical protein